MANELIVSPIQDGLFLFGTVIKAYLLGIRDESRVRRSVVTLTVKPSSMIPPILLQWQHSTQNGVSPRS